MIYNLVLEKPYQHLLHTWQDILAQVPAIDGERLYIRKALAEDGLLLNVREEQKETFNNTNYDYLVRMHAWLNMLTPMNYAVFHGSQILLLITIMPISQTVAEISFLTDRNFVESSKMVKFHMIKSFKAALLELPFPRIQAIVKANFDIGVNFVQKMGFEAEGVLKNYGINGDDYIMHSLIK